MSNDKLNADKLYTDQEALIDSILESKVYEEPDPLDEVRQLLVRASEIQETIIDMTMALKPKEAQLTAIKEEIKSIFEMMDINDLSANGYKFSLKTESSVRVPKTVEEKQEFFKYLEEQGLFYEVVGVNSMTLNKFYKEKAEEALDKGVIDFRLPGIETPKEYNVIKIKKGK